MGLLLRMLNGRLPDGFGLEAEPLAPDRLDLTRKTVESMIAEIDALEQHRRAVDDGLASAVSGAPSASASQVGEDGWGTWNRPVARSASQDQKAAAATRRWVQMQMRTDRAAAALAEYEYPE